MVYAKEKWFSLMPNEVETKTTNNYKCEMEQPSLKWNSPCGVCRQDLTFGTKAACLQPGIHLPFVHFSSFAFADFLLLIFTTVIKEFRLNAKGALVK